MPNGDVNFQLGRFSQFKDDIVNRVGRMDKKNIRAHSAINKNLEDLKEEVAQLNIWRIKVISYTAGLSTAVYFVLDNIIFR